MKKAGWIAGLIIVMVLGFGTGYLVQRFMSDRDGAKNDSDIFTRGSISEEEFKRIHKGFFFEGGGAEDGKKKKIEWEERDTGIGTIQALVFSPSVKGSRILAGTDQGIYASLDGGHTWEKTSAPQDLYMDIAVVPSNPDRLFAVSFGGIYRSIDGGKVWKAIRSIKSLEFHTIAINPDRPSEVWVGAWLRGEKGVSLFKSADWGDSWKGIRLKDLESVDINFVRFHGDRIFVGTYGYGIFASNDDGISWVELNQGLPLRTDITTLEFDPVDEDILYAGTHDFGIFKSKDGGRTWFPVNRGKEMARDVHWVVIDPKSPSTLYIADMHGGGIYRSTDGGGYWELISEGRKVDMVHAFDMDPRSRSIFLGLHDKLIVLREG